MLSITSVQKLTTTVLLAVFVLTSAPLAFAEEGGTPVPEPIIETLVGDSSSDGSTGSSTPSGTTEEPPQTESTGGATASNVGTTTIITGDASAGVTASTTLNSIDFDSELASTTASTSEYITDLDDYMFTASGTNDSNVDTIASSTATTGDNLASSSQSAAIIETGDAVAVLNIANVVNTNVVNSQGFMLLLNELLDGTQSFDVSDVFADSFPGYGHSNSTPSCNLVTCYAENITYRVENVNDATINNDAVLNASTGANGAFGKFGGISTGNAFASANVMNVANTNIIDSNYILVAVNGMGSLNGDLILPSGDFFSDFFAQPNGVNQALVDCKRNTYSLSLDRNQDGYIDVDANNDGVIDVRDYASCADEISLNNNNVNTAVVGNNLTTDANTGDNNATTTIDASRVTTGTSFSESNVENIVNQNLFGGDSLFIMIRVHGSWTGNILGLPEGISWQQTPDGIMIYSDGGEIVPSAAIAQDVDTYRANFDATNDVNIQNNIQLFALTGDNEVVADDGYIDTGNAYAGGNIMNVANTNVVGRNWVSALFNIFGDLNGDITFGKSDLWIGGQVTAQGPIVPGAELTYTYTVKNNGDLKATNVVVNQTYDWAQGGSLLSNSLGTIRPGETKEVTRTIRLRTDIPYGSIPQVATSTVRSSERDYSMEDNTEVLALIIENPDPNTGTSGGNSGGSSGSGSGNSGSGSSGSGSGSSGSGSGNSGGSSGGSSASSGGGGSSSGGGGSTNVAKKKKKGAVKGASTEAPKPVSEFQRKSPPKLEVLKKANAKKNKTKAGSSVDYTVTVRNTGGVAYDAQLIDTLRTPSGSIMSEQSWDLGDVQPNEVIKLEYTVAFAKDTPVGTYKNTAQLIAYRKDNDKTSLLTVKPAEHLMSVGGGVSFAVGNVEVLGFYPKPNGTVGAMVSWESTKPSDGQAYWSTLASTSPYNAVAPNLGYARSSAYMPAYTLKHYAYLDGLIPGTQYVYRVHSKTANNLGATSSEIPFTVPGTYVPQVTRSVQKPLASVTTKTSTAATAQAAASVTATAATSPSSPKSGIGSFVSGIANIFKSPWKK